jgi:hypothetical protein
VAHDVVVLRHATRVFAARDVDHLMGRIGDELHHHLGRGRGVDPARAITKADAPPSGATSSATGSGAARWAAIRSASSIARAPITRSCPPTISCGV